MTVRQWVGTLGILVSLVAAGAARADVAVNGTVSGNTITFPKVPDAQLNAAKFFGTLRVRLNTPALTYDKIGTSTLNLNGATPKKNGPGGYDPRRGAEWSALGGGTVDLRLPMGQLKFGGNSLVERLAKIQKKKNGVVKITFAMPGVTIRSAYLNFENATSSTLAEPTLTATSVTIPAVGASPANFRIAFASNIAVNYYECTFDATTTGPCASPFLANNLGIGQHNFKAIGWTRNGVQSGNTLKQNFQVKAPPTTKITILTVTPNTSPTTSTTMRFTFTNAAGNNPLKGFCSLDGAPVAACTSPYLLTNLPRGDHRVELRGTKEGVPAVYQWTVIAATPPVPSFVSTPPELTNSETTTFDFTADRPASFVCSVDGSQFSPCTAPYVIGLSPGAHVFRLVAKDAAGSSAPIEHRWIIDTLPATATLQMASPAQSPTTSKAMHLQFSVSEPATASCSLDGGAFAACASPVDYANLANGGHDVRLRLTDAAGNVSTVPLYAWVVDTIAPSVSITLQSPATVPTSQTSIVLKLTSNDAVRYTCSLDGLPPTSCGPTVSYSGLAVGQHEVAVIPFDAAGNAGDELSFVWQIDQTGPVLALSGVAPSGTPINTTSIQIGFTSDDAVRYTCNVDGNGETDCTSPLVVADLGDGEHQAVIAGYDQAGNASAPLTYLWTVDTVAPTINLFTATPGWTPTVHPTLTVEFSSEPGVQFRCALDGGAPFPCSSPWQITGLANGPHRASVVAIDAAGNPSAPIQYDWVVDSTFFVTDIAVESISGTSARVSWRTNIPATSQVRYGTTDLSQTTPVSATLTTSHSVVISGMTPDSRYTMQAVSTEPGGRITISDPVVFFTP